MLTYAATIDEFLDAWRWGDWNEFRIRIVGAKPVVTSWVNGVKIAELDMATLVAPNYDADAIAAFLGRRGTSPSRCTTTIPGSGSADGASTPHAAGGTSASRNCDYLLGVLDLVFRWPLRAAPAMTSIVCEAGAAPWCSQPTSIDLRSGTTSSSWSEAHRRL